MSKHVFTQADAADISTPSAGQVALFNDVNSGRFTRRTEGGDLVDIEGDGTMHWQRMGVVLEPDSGVDLTGIQEISVIYEEDPQVITDTGQSVFKCWYTGGYGGTRGLCYAESEDGITWSRKKTSGATIYVLSDLIHACVVKQGSTYYAFGANSTSSSLDVYSSADGITWSSVKIGGIVPSGSGGWDVTYIGNVMALYESGTWKIVYEALGDTGYGWSIGLATTTNLAGTWTKVTTTAPALGITAGTVGGPFIKKIGSTYWMWIHATTENPPDPAPTDIYRYYSTDLLTWTLSQDEPVLRRGPSDGPDSGTAQVADPWLVEVDGKVYMFYEGGSNGVNLYNAFKGKLAIADCTFDELVSKREAAHGIEYQSTGGTGNRVQITAFLAASTTVNNGVTTYLAFTATSLRGSNGSTLQNNFFNAGGTEWTAPRNGWYEVSLLVNITTLSTTGINVVLGITDGSGNYRNGGAFVQTFPTSTEQPSMRVTVRDYLYKGDVCKFRAYPTGGNITVSNSNLATILTIEEKPMP